jgi:hypothetical protein
MENDYERCVPLYGRLVDHWLGGPDREAFVIHASGNASKSPGDGTVRPAFFAPHWTVIGAPDGESYLEHMKRLIAEHRPSRLLLVPPMLAAKCLSPELRTAYPRADLFQIALLQAIDTAPNTERVGILLPSFALTSQSAAAIRTQIFQQWQPSLFITHQGRIMLFEGVHPAFSPCVLGLVPYMRDWQPLRMYRMPASAHVSDEEVLADFEALLRQMGGRTRFGYVVRDRIPASEPITFDRYDPEVLERLAGLKALGELRPLENLVQIIRPVMIGPGSDALLPAGTTVAGVPLLEGRHITANGAIDLRELRYRVVVPEEHYLRPGDICVRAIVGGAQQLHTAYVLPGDEPMAASHTVLVLRPHASVSDLERAVISQYLRTVHAMEYLRGEGMGGAINAHQLRGMSIPVPDAELQTALNELQRAVWHFGQWMSEARAVADSVFDAESPSEGRRRVVDAGLRVRQRIRAANDIDDFGHRVRSRFPYPIALRWSLVQASLPDVDGYLAVLECTEILQAYAALCGIIMANSARIELGQVTSLRQRLAEGRGISLGDWASILTEIRDGRRFRSLPDNAPFAELKGMFRDRDVEDARRRLAERRNDQSHLRRITGDRLKDAFETAKADLATLLEAAEFLSDYPLRRIDTTQWDALTGENLVTYREMMGDHEVVPVTSATLYSSEFEPKSLYLVDRSGEWHLLRPYLVGQECPECGHWSIFHLERYDRASDSPVLKSLEHSHAVFRPDLLAAFRHVGVLE